MTADRIPRKHFWRRAGAFLIDWLIISTVVLVLTALVQTLSPIQPVAPNLLNYWSCSAGPEAIKKLDADRLLPLRSGEQRLGRFCEVSQFGVMRHYVQSIGAIKQEGSVTHRRILNMYVDADGNPIKVFSMGALMVILAPLVFAAFLSHSGRTPGKAAMKLYVAQRRLLFVPFKAALLRELLRFLPLVVYSVWLLYTELTFDLEDAAQMLDQADTGLAFVLPWVAAGLVVTVVTLGYWFLPFIRWRGQTVYDRLAGLYVRGVLPADAANH